MPRTSTNLARFVTPFLLAAFFCACGRREEPAAFDAKTQTVTGEEGSAAAPLAPSAIEVKWGAATVPPAFDAGSTNSVLVTFTNSGDAPWPDKLLGDPKRRDGAHAVRLGYAWSDGRDSDADPNYASTRVDMPHPIQPGESVTLGIAVLAPERPGDYKLTFDLVQELDFWFSSRGADVLMKAVTVQPAAGAAPTRTQ